MYNHDPQNTGRSEYLGPDVDAAVRLEWTPYLQLQTSISIDYNNNIYLNTVLDSGGIHIKKITAEGTLLWNSIQGSDSYCYSTPTLAADSIIYTSSNNGYIWALSQTTGSLLWETYVGEYIYSFNIVLDLAGNLYVPLTDRLISMDSQGALRWTSLIADLNQAGSISPDGTTLYYGNRDLLYAVSTMDGNIVNTFPAAGVQAPTVSNKGHLFFQNYRDTSIICLSPNFEVIWQYHVGRKGGTGVSLESGTIDYQGNYYTTAAGKFLSFTYTGELRWQVDLSDFVQGTALISSIPDTL